MQFLFDYGTNYCNLHNLVVGAGLDKKYDFKKTLHVLSTQLPTVRSTDSTAPATGNVKMK